MLKKQDFIIVVEIRDGILDSSRLFTDNKKAEACFKKIIKEISAVKISEDDMEEYLDDGYYETPQNSWSVCISHPLQ